MSYRRLNKEEVIKLKELVMRGVLPKDIANFFKIAISSVHNHKRSLREQGLNIPIARKGAFERYHSKEPPQVHVQGNQLEVGAQYYFDKEGNVHLIINDASIIIGFMANKVCITNNQVIIEV
ncbi:hypothetical protein [Pontibacter beigongshangensis]|uniref:hypothetical protein n=1 Tax=Pontibacter beigongshangensis TaxID=2574733 RepID=UPI001650975F|nr:hypothetical protein [Pontibacter beigongshangensis]